MADKGRTALEQEIDRIDAGGETWENSAPAEEPIRVKRPLDTILRVRFSAEQFRNLDRLAEETGVGPSTLVRMWVLERLKAPTRR
jgi:hypothetical protein